MCFPIVVLSFSLEQSNIHGINFDSCKRNYFLIVQYRNILKVGGLFQQSYTCLCAVSFFVTLQCSFPGEQTVLIYLLTGARFSFTDTDLNMKTLPIFLLVVALAAVSIKRESVFLSRQLWTNFDGIFKFPQHHC